MIILNKVIYHFNVLEPKENFEDEAIRQSKCKDIEEKAAQLKQKLNETEKKIKEVILNKEKRMRSKSSEPINQSINSSGTKKTAQYDRINRGIWLISNLFNTHLKKMHLNIWKLHRVKTIQTVWIKPILESEHHNDRYNHISKSSTESQKIEEVQVNKIINDVSNTNENWSPRWWKKWGKTKKWNNKGKQTTPRINNQSKFELSKDLNLVKERKTRKSPERLTENMLNNALHSKITNSELIFEAHIAKRNVQFWRILFRKYQLMQRNAFKKFKNNTELWRQSRIISIKLMFQITNSRIIRQVLHKWRKWHRTSSIQIWGTNYNYI